MKIAPSVILNQNFNVQNVVICCWWTWKSYKRFIIHIHTPLFGMAYTCLLIITHSPYTATSSQWIYIEFLSLACKNLITPHIFMFAHCIIVAVVIPHIDILNIKAFLAVTRSIEYLMLKCVYSFYNVLILVNVCLSVHYYVEILHSKQYSLLIMFGNIGSYLTNYLIQQTLNLNIF